MMSNRYLIVYLYFFVLFLSCSDQSISDLNFKFECYDFKYSDLHVDFDLLNQEITGSNLMYFKANCPIETIAIDLFSNLHVDSVLLDNKKVDYSRNKHQILVKSNINQDILFSVNIFYHGKPVTAKRPPWEGGFVWSKDNDKYDWVGVACQKDGGRLWWPVKHDLSDEPDSMRITLGVEEPYVIVSNGQLLSIQEVDDHNRIFEWMVRNPINNYNVTFNIANYQQFGDTLHGVNGILNLDYYVLPYNLMLAKDHFRQVKPMLNVFEKLFGPYPFYSDGYKMVETNYLGMEHQSCISYGNKFMKGYLGSFPDEMDFDFIIIHETAHEWWGNSLSMKSQEDMWIHESFATYAEALYVEEVYGYDDMITYLNSQKDKITNTNPIYDKHHTTTDMYYKGSWMLHTLRTVLQNDELWDSILRGLQSEFKHKTINTIMVINYIEDKCNCHLASFFQQYLFHSDLPVFEYFFHEINNKTFLNFRWEAFSSSFDMPVLAKVSNETYTWIYPDSAWSKIELAGISSQDFSIAQDLFLVEEKKVR